MKLKSIMEEKRKSNFDDFLAEQLQNSEVKAEYDALEDEYAILQGMIFDHEKKTK